MFMLSMEEPRLYEIKQGLDLEALSAYKFD